MMPGFVDLVAIPAGLGLIGFVEPCSIGSTLLVVKYLEGKSAGRKLAEAMLFTVTRGLFIGALGATAALIGSLFIGFQKAAWIALGFLYIGIGALLALRQAGPLMVAIGPSLARLSGLPGAAGLGFLFGINIPACAAPLLFAMLGAAAAGGAAGGAIAAGFVSLAVFGLALSLPLVAALLVSRTRTLLDRISALSDRFPIWAGLILILLGLWSIGFALFARIAPA
jgi:cytochrome c-type biogenesis protein